MVTVGGSEVVEELGWGGENMVTQWKRKAGLSLSPLQSITHSINLWSSDSRDKLN